jgi:DNA adenine methylase
MGRNNLVTPPLKWVGGKRQLLPVIRKYIPNAFSMYYEPFFGGGAVLFDLQPQKAVVNDINEELINLYIVIRDNIDNLLYESAQHKNTSEYFYYLRGLDRDKEMYNQLSPIKKASRMHYLNKTCYNGLFRVNQAGEFNAPFGRYINPNIINEDTLRAVSEYLNNSDITFKCTDFINAVDGIDKDSFVYLDPPYDPISDSSNFTGYATNGFNRGEQIRLKNLCENLDKMGVRFLLSNSDTEFIRELYSKFNIVIIQAKRAVNSNPNKRGEINEVLVRNY